MLIGTLSFFTEGRQAPGRAVCLSIPLGREQLQIANEGSSKILYGFVEPLCAVEIYSP